MVCIVDFDNRPGANIQGVNRLDSDDTVYIYYASGNKFFCRPDRQEEIKRKAKCSIRFIKIPAADNAVDFAIALDLGEIIKEFPSEIIVLISDDKHFETIISRAKDTKNCASIYLVSDINEAIERYKLLESNSLHEVHMYLTWSYGQEKGGEFYRNLEIFFKQKYLRENSIDNCIQVEKMTTTTKLMNKLKAVVVTAFRVEAIVRIRALKKIICFKEAES